MAADPHDATVDALVGYYKTGNGEHPDWEDYRGAMVADKRLLVVLRPERAYGMVAPRLDDPAHRPPRGLRPGARPAWPRRSAPARR